MSLIEFLSRPTVPATLLLLFTFAVYRWATADTLAATNVPWMNLRKKSLFSKTRAGFANFNNLRRSVMDAYNEVTTTARKMAIGIAANVLN